MQAGSRHQSQSHSSRSISTISNKQSDSEAEPEVKVCNVNTTAKLSARHGASVNATLEALRLEKEKVLAHANAKATGNQSVPSAANGSCGNGSDNSATASDLLRVLATLLSPTELNVLPGAVIQECQLGQLRVAWYALDNNRFLPLVVKEFAVPRATDDDALTELQIHVYVQCKRIANVIGLYAIHLNKNSNTLSAYLECATNGDLFALVKARARGDGLPLSLCGGLFVQLLRGVAALHSINVVHRDLSLENVLLTADHQVKICDFGLATICAPGHTIRDGQSIGKPNYMSPEVYYGEEYDPRMADVWAAAVIFFIMLTGLFPYSRPSLSDARLILLCQGRINEMLVLWQRRTFQREVLQVFSKMFCPPKQRWTAQQLLQLPLCQRFTKPAHEDATATATATAATGAGTFGAGAVRHSQIYAQPHVHTRADAQDVQTMANRSTSAAAEAVQSYSKLHSNSGKDKVWHAAGAALPECPSMSAQPFPSPLPPPSLSSLPSPPSPSPLPPSASSTSVSLPPAPLVSCTEISDFSSSSPSPVLRDRLFGPTTHFS